MKASPRDTRRAVSPMEQWNWEHRNDGQAGKGSSPRSCFSEEFRRNYDLIQWKSPKFEQCKT